MEVTPKKASPLLEWTGERYLPWLEDAAIGYEHLHRYAYASQFVEGKRVLDLACGEGYGSYLLARSAKFVLGVDIDEVTITHASSKYINDVLDFRVGSITDIPLEGEDLFDVIVCFEAIEHVEDHEHLLKEVKRLLSPGGLFVVSTPNKWAYSDQAQYKNPFHLHELYFREFKDLLGRYFKDVQFLGQRIYCTSDIWPVFLQSDIKFSEYLVEKNTKEFIFVNRDNRIPQFFIALASDADGEIQLTKSALTDISDALLKQKDLYIASLSKEQGRLTEEIAHLQEHLAAQEKGWNQQSEALQAALTQKEQQAMQIAQEAERATRDNEGLRASLEQKLAEVSEELERATRDNEGLRASLEQKRAEFTALVGEMDRAIQDNEQLRATLQENQREIILLSEERKRLGHEASQLEHALEYDQKVLETIYSSLGWKSLLRFRQLKDRLLGTNTRRRKIYDVALGKIKNVNMIKGSKVN